MSIWATRQCLRRVQSILLRQNAPQRRSIASGAAVLHETDACGIPLKPTWSVNELLSSYPTPTLSSATLNHLHQLSALVAPEEGTQEHTKLKQEMEDLIRLVEAVKLVETDGVCTVGRESTHQTAPPQRHSDIAISGRRLLDYAARTTEEFYVVDTDRKR